MHDHDAGAPALAVGAADVRVLVHLLLYVLQGQCRVSALIGFGGERRECRQRRNLPLDTWLDYVQHTHITPNPKPPSTHLHRSKTARLFVLSIFFLLMSHSGVRFVRLCGCLHLFAFPCDLIRLSNMQAVTLQ